MSKMRVRFQWLLPKKEEFDFQTIELQHEYQHPQAALDDIAKGVDKREPPTVPTVQSDSPGDTTNVGRYLKWKDRGK